MKSLVQVYFPRRDLTLSYYNDAFDLHRGDRVFVEGKLEGLPGRVTAVSYNFKIRLADYKRVIALADTDVRGQFYPAGSHLVTFDADALAPEKVRTWFLPPTAEDGAYIVGQDGASFPLSDLSSLGADIAVAERGQKYYAENRVAYLVLDGASGCAIVEGTKPYEVEFTYADGQVSGLVCPCYCSCPCKHQVAVLLQLRETLSLLEERYPDRYAPGGRFAAVSKGAFLTCVLDGREDMCLTLS